MNSLLKTLGNTSLIFLCVIALVVDALFIYYRFIDPSKTIGVNIIGEQVGVDSWLYETDMSEDEIKDFQDRMIFEINLYDNTNQNGIWLAEFQFNYFTTWELKVADYRSSGYQIALNISPDNENYFAYEYLFGESVLNIPFAGNSNVVEMQSNTNYETTDGVNWNGNEHIVTGLEQNKEYIIKIDNEAYTLNLNGTYTKWEPLWGFLWNVENTYNYTFDDLYITLLQAAANSDKGAGTFYITPDLSDWFTIKKFDENGVIQEQVYTDIVKNYATVKVNYSHDGAVNSSQSLFNMIDSNPSFNLAETDLDTEYWASNVVYNLNEEYLTYRYSESYGGYLVSISQDIINKFVDMPRSKINIILDLSTDYLINQKYNVVGLDYNAFSGLDLSSLTIRSDSPITLYMLDYCLNDSLKTLNYTSNITFSWSANSSIPAGCEGVII